MGSAQRLGNGNILITLALTRTLVEVNQAGDDIPPFIEVLIAGDSQVQADTNCDDAVTFADIPVFIGILISTSTP